MLGLFTKHPWHGVPTDSHCILLSLCSAQHAVLGSTRHMQETSSVQSVLHTVSAMEKELPSAAAKKASSEPRKIHQRWHAHVSLAYFLYIFFRTFCVNLYIWCCRYAWISPLWYIKGHFYSLKRKADNFPVWISLLHVLLRQISTLGNLWLVYSKGNDEGNHPRRFTKLNYKSTALSEIENVLMYFWLIKL